MTDKQSIKCIAIDGTAASGKGTLARRLAEKLGFAHLDTGKLYRYVGYETIRQGKDPADERDAVSVAEALSESLDTDILDNPVLKSDEAGTAASLVGKFQGVRDALFDFQRAFAFGTHDGYLGTVLDGRDIGTVVCPEADVKFYVDAPVTIRAERRHKELQSSGISVTYEAVLEDMRARDERDAGREAAPLKPADDAIIIDTGALTIDDVLQMACDHVENFQNK